MVRASANPAAGVIIALTRELHVGDDRQQVIAVSPRLDLCTLVVRSQQDLGTGAHAHQLVGDVDAFAQQAARLTDEFRVNHRQEQGVVADVVLHHQDHGNIHRFGVVVDVALVLDVLHDRDEDASVALPEEDALDVGLRIARDEIRDLAVVVGQDNYRHLETGVLDLARQLRGIHVHDVQVADDEVEARLRARQRPALLLRSRRGSRPGPGAAPAPAIRRSAAR